VITNYSLRVQEMAFHLPVNVSYDSDPDVVERVLVEEATAAAHDLSGLVADPPPFVRFMPGFGDSALGFTLTYRVASYVSVT
jgi:small-conductance mechanosensitive channel